VILVDIGRRQHSHLRTRELLSTLLREAGSIGQLNGSGPVGLPWASMLAFLRLVTNPRVFERPEPIGDAWRQVHAWLACETAWIPQPTERHAELLAQFLTLPGIHGNLIPDAHLAALAVEHGLTLCSTDGDFARFRGLRWLNPITP
jgi:toxin-antitoxin system PIN domain toxin